MPIERVDAWPVDVTNLDITNAKVVKDGSYQRLIDVIEDPQTLGLGTMATQAASNVAITGGSISGVTVTLPSLAVTATTTPYNSDPTAGYFSEYEGATAGLLYLTQSEVQAADESGGIRSALTVWHQDSDGTNYSTGSYRTISEGLRVGSFGPNDGAGTYSADYKDHHGITSVAISRTEWAPRGVAAFAGDSVQMGSGVCLNEILVSNPSGASNQSGQMAGWYIVLSGKKAAADASHTNHGMFVHNIGKLATAGAEWLSGGTDGDSGNYNVWLRAASATVETAAIVMPQSSSGDVGTYISYDSGDYSFFNRAGNSFGWAVGGANRIQLDAGTLFPSSNDGAALGYNTLSWSDLFLASGAVVNFNNGDVTLTHSANALTLAGGTLAIPAQSLTVGGGAVREPLTASRTYYVRTDGSDSNTGLVNNAGGAFLTLQKAWRTISDTLDIGDHTVTVQVADGTYTAGVVADGPFVGTGNVVFNGNSGTPANVIVSTTSSDCFQTIDRARISVQNMELRTTTAGNGLHALYGGHIYHSGLRFGTCAGSHIQAALGGRISCYAAYSIVGGALSHYHAYSNGLIDVTGVTVTLTGTPAFTNYFAGAAVGHITTVGVTFSGAATGTRFLSHKNAVIETNGGGANFYPGNVAGSNPTGGQYV